MAREKDARRGGTLPKGTLANGALTKETLAIRLSRREIDGVFAGWRREKAKRDKKWAKLFAAYAFLLAHVEHPGAPAVKEEYERTFNYFYQVRRNAEWRRKFYELFARHARRAGRADFERILRELHAATGQVEMSFASKLAATLDPGLPLIDRHVLSYLGNPVRPARPGGADTGRRLREIVRLHSDMRRSFNAYLATPDGRYLIARFRKEFPEARISRMKMLDFVLWQSGGKKN